jgi:hypothetical protein
MLHIKILEDVVTSKSIPLYIEHNDFLNGGLDIHEEIQELLDDHDIDENMAERMAKHQSIWSIRYYYDPHRFEIFYADTLESVVNKLLSKLGV